MDWFGFVDIYCERTAPGFWNEPLNALSNLSFIAAAVWAWVEMDRRRLENLALRAAIALAFSIGVGSFLFHTFAQQWSALADVIPIWTFVAYFVLLAIRHFGDVQPGRVPMIAPATIAAVAVGFWVTSGRHVRTHNLSDAGPGPLNGSEQYAPALVALYVFVGVAWWRKLDVRGWIAAAAVAFTLSLGFRTVDQMVCAALPFGTHFLWHLLNGAMIAILLQAMLRRLDNARNAVAGG